MVKNKTLCLYTLEFPYGSGETFLENELPYLSNAFEEILIFPMKKQEVCRAIPSNVKVVLLSKDIDGAGVSYLKVLPQVLPNITKKVYLKHLKVEVARLRIIHKLSERLYDVVKDKSGVIHYSYWFDFWVIVLGVLKKQNRIVKVISRAHGFDLYESRHSFGYHPYRTIQKETVSKLFSVSKFGTEYLKRKMKTLPIETAFLGTKDCGENGKNKLKKYHIVSCSANNKIKRLPLILEILRNVTIDIHWTHIGGDNLEQLINDSTQKLPNNVSTCFLGQVRNTEVTAYYQENWVDVFINVSSTEGIPVSMMEAISFGIPIIGTNVGGVSEIVNDKTGLLIPKDFNPKEVALAIERKIVDDFENGLYRLGVRKFWEENFSAEKNYSKFTQMLLEE